MADINEIYPNTPEGLMEQIGGMYLPMPQRQTVGLGEAFANSYGLAQAGYGIGSSLTSGLVGKRGNTYIGKNGTYSTLTNTGTGKGGNFLQDLASVDGVEGSYNASAIQNILGNTPKNFFAKGGAISYDNGSMISAATGLVGGAIGAIAGGIKTAQQRAAYDAQYNEQLAQRSFLNDRMSHNINLAVQDTKDNMFNMQAIQMMAFGGDLNANGTDWPLSGDFNVIGAGGTHEQNPNMGVPQGIAPDGQPNLVEEGEVVWNDYVFSKRLKVTDKFAKDHKISEDMYFADAAQKLTEESRERPNDPISMNGIEAALGSLREEQETVKARIEARRMKAALKKMSPEELMALQQIMQGQDPQMAMQQPMDQPMEQGMPMEAPQEEQMLGAEGMYAEGGHLFDGTSGNSQMTSEQDSTLAYRYLGQFTDAALRWMIDRNTNVFKNFNPANFTSGNSREALLQYMVDSLLKDSKLTGAKSAYDIATKLDIKERKDAEGNATTWDKVRRAADDDPNKSEWSLYSETEDGRSIKNWIDLAKAYNLSKQSGNTAGTYQYERTKEDVDAIENSEEFKALTNNLIASIRGDGPYSLEESMQLLRVLDDNTPEDVAKIFKSGTGDNRGKADLVEGWEDLIKNRRNDDKWSIYHLGADLANLRKNYIRNVYLKDGQEINVDGSFNNPLYNLQKGELRVDSDGNLTQIYNITGTPPSDPTIPTDVPIDNIPKLPTGMRFAPVLGSLIGAAGTYFTPKKNYDTRFTPRLSTYQPIGDYLARQDVDTQRYLNAEQQAYAQQLAAIQNATGANRNMAMAQAAVANQQRQAGIANVLQNAEATNWTRQAQRGEFNRGTNQYNATAFNQNSAQNMGVNSLLYQQAAQNQAMRHQVDNEWDLALGENLTNMFDNIGNIGRENFAMNQVNSNKALYQGVGFNGDAFYKRLFGKNGGLLTKNNRRRR